MSVLDLTTNREQVIRDLTDFAEGLIDENGMLQRQKDELRRRNVVVTCLNESVLGHNERLIHRVEFWRGKAVYAFAAGLLLGSGAIAASTLDAWQIFDRALTAVGL